MPSPSNLLGKVATLQNLYKAWQHISKHVKDKSHGMSDETIEDFRSNLKSNINTIREQLLSGKYEFGDPRGIIKEKTDGGKRPLTIFDVRDRVVQRALASKLEKFLGARFKLDNAASFAYLPKKKGRPAKGVQSAIKQMLKYHQEGCNWVFEADIVKFFDRVNRDQLLNKMIYPNLPDETINNLIKEIFEMEIGNKDDLPEDDWKLYPDGYIGLPQGGYLSPLFSNVYLSEFDREMIKAHFRLIRYADDFIVMCKRRDEAENAYILAKTLLEERLSLQIHRRNDKDQKAKTRILKLKKKKITFLGVQFDGIYILPDPEKKVELSNKLWKIRKKSKHVLELLTSTKNLLDGWIASYAFTNIDEKYLEIIDNEVNKTLWSTLYTFGWRLKPRDLSKKQRECSGANPVSWHLYKIRASLSDEDRELLAKYWTKFA